MTTVQVQTPMIGDWVTLKTREMPKTSKREGYHHLLYPDRMFQVAEINGTQIHIFKRIGPDFPPVDTTIPTRWIDRVWRNLPERGSDK